MLKSIIKIVFISNFFNHHQLGLCDELYLLCSGNFSFICTSNIPKERIKLGYGNDLQRPYLVSYQSNSSQSQEIIDASDAIIAGDCDDKLLVHARLENKLILKYSEHNFKKRYPPVFNLLNFIRVALKKKLIRYSENEFLLCASSFVSTEYKKMNLPYKNYLKFGYFPITAFHNEQACLFKDETVHFLWGGRFLKWKHPEYALKVIKTLTVNGFDVDLTIVGCGEKKIEEKLVRYVNKNNLTEKVNFLGSVSYDLMSSIYKKNDVFLFTSDQNEGWGAVLNEAMSHGLVVFASSKAGSTRYLNSNNNLFLFKNKKDLISKSFLCVSKNKDVLIESGRRNRELINNLWNYKIAANRLFTFCYTYFKNKSILCLQDGPLSLD